MVITEDNIGLIRILLGIFIVITVTGYRIIGTNNIVMLAVDDFIAEAIDVVVL